MKKVVIALFIGIFSIGGLALAASDQNIYIDSLFDRFSVDLDSFTALDTK